MGLEPAAGVGAGVGGVSGVGGVGAGGAGVGAGVGVLGPAQRCTQLFEHASKADAGLCGHSAMHAFSEPPGQSPGAGVGAGLCSHDDKDDLASEIKDSSHWLHAGRTHLGSVAS